MTQSRSVVDEEIVDLEECAREDRRPPRAKKYRIRIDREHYIVEEPGLTGRGLLELAGKTPVECFMVVQRLRGGKTKRIGLDELADFTTPGVERFMDSCRSTRVRALTSAAGSPGSRR